MTKVSKEAQRERFALLNILTNAVKLVGESEAFTPHEKLSILKAAKELVDEQTDRIVEELR